MAIFRGTGGSVEGITEADILLITIPQGGTGARSAADARTNLGLGTAATTNASAYATAAQGALADTALQSFTETDPVFTASEAASITSTDTTNWDTAYTDRLKWDGGSTGLNASTARTSLGLGTAATTDATAYATAAQGSKADTAVQPGSLATVATSGSYNDLSNKPTIPTNLDSLTDVVITSPTTNQTLQYNGTNWVNATGGTGTVTSVAMSVPTGLSVSGSPVTTSGTLAVTYASGYSIPTTTSQTNWDTAYGWGNHASAGYVTSGGALGTPSSGNLANCTFPTLNQNTTGTAGGLSGTPNITVGTINATSGTFTGVLTPTGGIINGAVFNKTGSGGEGGELQLEKGTTSTLSGNVVVDLLDQSVRFFDSAGTNKGASLDISAQSAGVGSTILTSSTSAASFPTLNQNTTGTAANVSGTVAIANGGTGQTTATAAFNALAPSQTGNSGKYLTTDGTNTSWGTISSSGTVTSVAATVPSFLSVTGSPITTSGTLAISYSGTALPVANGGTGITSFGSGVATWLGTPSSANLAAAITDETGSGSLVFGTSPTLTTPNINSAQIATVSGSAPLYMCRAWVNFNGSGTVSIRASGNVSSITDNGTGDYTVNFTTALTDANYSVASYAHNNSDSSAWIRFVSGPSNSVPKTSSSFRITSVNVAWNNVDTNQIDIAVFR